MSELHAGAVQIEECLDSPVRLTDNSKIATLCTALSLLDMGDSVAEPPKTVYEAIDQAKGLLGLK